MRTSFALIATVASTVHAQTPAPRNSHALVSAGPAGSVLLIGGGSGNAPRLADTLWTWTGTTWRARSDAGPRSRTLPAAAFDARRGVMVVYGGAGIGSGTRFGDIWEWDGRRWEEKNVRTPGPRDHHAMAYDEARGKMVVFGGLVGSSLVAGTWTWDGITWTMADSSTGPGPAGHHAMAYDIRRQRVVMYRGLPSSGPRLSDTWEWNGERHTSPGPPARWSPAMAYDAARQRIVLFGGGRNAPPYGSLGDTWEWDGTRWEPTPYHQPHEQARPADRR